MPEAILQKLKPTRTEIYAFAFGVGIGLLAPRLLPYWRLFAFVGIMTVLVWNEFRRK